MDYMFEAGFLGTRAPFFMDFVTIMVFLLPILVFGAISMAKVKSYKAHALTQQVIFIIAVIVVGYFEYGVRLVGGFNALMEGSNTSHNYAFWVLIVHIIIAVIGLILWVKILWKARKDRDNHKLPGQFSVKHKQEGIVTFIAIFLTAFSGLWVYFLLFIY